MTASDGHVLVLNRSWIAIHIASVRRALTLLYVGSAHAVHPAEYSLHRFDEWLALSQNGLGGRYIHTPTLRVRVPEVVLLRQFNGFLRHEVRFTRQSLLERDNHVCQYCGKHFPRSQLTIDHVVPQSRGGEDSWENLTVACLKCNVRKGNRTPHEAGMPLLRKPRKPHWMPRLGARIPPEQLMVWRRFVDTSYWTLPQQEIV
jgi:5-methylcytosine-specific restriction endonuclease McrA